MTDRAFNFPSTQRADVAPALVSDIVPTLADAIHEAATGIAERECGERTSIFDVERVASDLLYALADLLTLAPVPLRGVRDLLRWHQLDAAHAAAYFECDYTPALAVVTDGEHGRDHRAEGEADEYETEEAVTPTTGATVARSGGRDRGVVQFPDAAAAARALGLPADVLGGAGDRQPCGNPDCKETFIPIRQNQKFHSSDCRNAYHNKRRERGQADVPLCECGCGEPARATSKYADPTHRRTAYNHRRSEAKAGAR
jgi:hypothetical protein